MIRNMFKDMARGWTSGENMRLWLESGMVRREAIYAFKADSHLVCDDSDVRREGCATHNIPLDAATYCLAEFGKIRRDSVDIEPMALAVQKAVATKGCCKVAYYIDENTWLIMYIWYHQPTNRILTTGQGSDMPNGGGNQALELTASDQEQ
jgi:hypothetical protein